MMEDFKDFLSLNKQQFKQFKKKDFSELDSITIVLGNTACDLDSIICSLVYAYYLFRSCVLDSILVIPVINTSRCHFPTLTESVFHLRSLEINDDDILFRDDMDLQLLSIKTTLSICLVDHNVLVGEDTSFNQYVRRIVDHHMLETCASTSLTITHGSVGSCATLVSEICMSIMNTYVAKLLYGPILLDTACLLDKSGIATPRDEEMAKKLEQFFETFNRQDTFNSLQSAKSNIQDLSTIQVLNKDVKFIRSNNVSVAVSAVPADLHDFFARNKVEQDLQNFSLQHSVKAVVVLTLVVVGTPYRQLAVFSNDDDLSNKIVSILLSSESPNLCLTRVENNHALKFSKLFNQMNFSPSRKKILPLLQENLRNC